MKIHRHIRRCLLITYMFFCWFISPTLLHNAMRKFETLFRATRYIPGNFFVIFDAKSHVWGQFGPENKLIEGQPNEYDHGAKRRFYTVVRRDLPERVSVSVPPVANDSCRSAVPAPKYLPERRSIAFPYYYTPVHDVSRMSHISW